MDIYGSRSLRHHQNSTRRNGGGRGKKSAKFRAPHFRAPPPFGPHSSGSSGFGPPPFKPGPGPTLQGPTMTHTRSKIGLAKNWFDPAITTMTKNGSAKIGLAQIGQIRMARTGLAKVGLFRRIVCSGTSSTFHLLFQRSEVEIGTSDSSMTGPHGHWSEVVELATTSPLALVASKETKQSSTKEGISVMCWDRTSFFDHLSVHDFFMRGKLNTHTDTRKRTTESFHVKSLRLSYHIRSFIWNVSLVQKTANCGSLLIWVSFTPSSQVFVVSIPDLDIDACLFISVARWSARCASPPDFQLAEFHEYQHPIGCGTLPKDNEIFTEKVPSYAQ